MKKLITFAFIVIFGSGVIYWSLPKLETAPVAFHAKSANKYQTAQESVALLETDTGYGSGFIIQRWSIADSKPRLFVWTAAHVVRGSDTVKVRRTLHFNGTKAGEMIFSAKVILRLRNADAALLWVDAPPGAFAAVEFSATEPVIGSSIFHVGNLLKEFDSSVSRGIVSQTGVRPAGSEWPWEVVDQTDLNITPGSSGGPVFDNSGKVIGIVVGGPAQGRSGIGCFVPVRALLADPVSATWAISGSKWCAPDSLLDVMAKAAELPKVIEAVVPSSPAKPEPIQNKPKSSPFFPKRG